MMEDKPAMDSQFEDKQQEEAYQVVEIDPALDKRITRKFDINIVPWLFGMWLLAFIDRSNIGNARIDGLPEDLELKRNQFNIALTVFYVPYILVDERIRSLSRLHGCHDMGRRRS